MDTDEFEELESLFAQGSAALTRKPATGQQVDEKLKKEYTDPKNWIYSGIVGIRHGDFCIGMFACYNHIREAGCRRLVAEPNAPKADRYEEMSPP
jgi:hypothetical protein